MQLARTKIIAAFIFTLPLVVGALATLWFIKPEWQPQGRTSQGDILIPQALLPEPMHAADRVWQVVTLAHGDCADDCKARLWVMRQAYWALGKGSRRASDSLLLVGDARPDVALRADFPNLRLYHWSTSQLRDWLDTNPQVPQPANLEIWLVDPLGYVVLRYSPQHTGNQLLIDWRKLLKHSQIG